MGSMGSLFLDFSLSCKSHKGKTQSIPGVYSTHCPETPSLRNQQSINGLRANLHKLCPKERNYLYYFGQEANKLLSPDGRHYVCLPKSTNTAFASPFTQKRRTDKLSMKNCVPQILTRLLNLSHILGS